MKTGGLKSSKPFGVFCLVIGVFAALVIFHRIGCYFYEYDPEFAPYDYGRLNFFSYFTIQSNIFVCIYLLMTAFAVFGSEKAAKVASNPVAGALVTTYIIVTGAVYCCGIPLGFTPPFVWDTPVHAMSSFIQVFHHMIIPPLMILLWFFPVSDKRIPYRFLPYFGIYPFVYSLFCIIRGAVSDPPFYAYPFYNPEFVFGLFFRNETYTGQASGYVLMLPLLVVGIGVFIGVAAVVIAVHNKRIHAVNCN